LASQIELRAAAAQISSLSSGMFMMPNNNQTIQQEVTIHADFPGVTSSYEIEQALNNIVNKASQYVNRKF
jgi:hypothetical protein